MCGVAGVIRFDGAPVVQATLGAMAESLSHRGPDGSGFWRSGSVGLAHRRLSIIDLAGSAQPMVSHDGSLAVCFNGEVLNYRELRQQLSAYPYRTQGDTEVLLASFAAHGPQGVSRLRGQFAFAVHDRDDASLWLFRDPMGVLPLYYYRSPEAFYFASEVKAVLAALPSQPPVDDDSLDAFLAARAVAAPFTLFSGVRKVRPGCALHVRRDGSIEEVPYWAPPEAPVLDDLDDATATGRVADALQAAVERNLVADVPVGAYLSGGVDSSLVVALMTRAHSGPVETFSAGFGDERLDEVAWARRVSEHLGTHHHEVTVLPEDFVRQWSRLTWHRDAPLSEPADVAVHRLAALAREHVKVVLSGEGSDELFGGYPKHRFARLGVALDAVPGGVHRPVLRAAEGRLPSRLNRVRTAMRAFAAGDEDERLEMWFSPFTRREREELLGRELVRGGRPPTPGSSPLDRQLRHDLRSWLPDNLLERGDRMSMAASLELRPPFLDADVAALALRLPDRFKVRGGTGKWVVKEVAQALLPLEVVHRPKSGFRVPLDRWFRGSLRDLAHDKLTGPSSFVATRFDQAAVRALLDRHSRGRADEQIRIWTLLSLEVWHDVFYKGVATPSSVERCAAAGGAAAPDAGGPDGVEDAAAR